MQLPLHRCGVALTIVTGPGSAIPSHWRELSDGHSNVGYDLQSAHDR
jgi:hypothetical protein